VAIKTERESCIASKACYVVVVMTRAPPVVGGSLGTGKCRAAGDSRSVSVRTTGPVQACVSDTALPHVIHRDVSRQQGLASARWHGDASRQVVMSSADAPLTGELWLAVFWLVMFLTENRREGSNAPSCGSQVDPVSDFYWLVSGRNMSIKSSHHLPLRLWVLIFVI